MNFDDVMRQLVDALLPIQNKEMALVFHVNFDYSVWIEEKEEFETLKYRAQYIVHRPNNYVKVYIKINKEEYWTETADHDSCWIEGLTSPINHLYREEVLPSLKKYETKKYRIEEFDIFHKTRLHKILKQEPIDPTVRYGGKFKIELENYSNYYKNYKGIEDG